MESLTLRCDVQLDVRGAACPIPVLKAKRALAQLGSGQVLEVLATDRTTLRDFRVFAESAGHELLCSEDRGEQLRFAIQKG
ncbi:transcriptional regulator [Sorangium cellulosum]|uniref:Transcriptional regulator n=1 Tax=Sorangium cellulosum TaxID=56 RepID=A0A4P2Q130_SORCE|nr:sulfurtransferase TusA family protein [Sorangium cellulosum]AUX22553.1 transcriptional regulator [Sorangium cellulosum]